ncbi:MAG: TolC family protein [Nitrospinae bacterium]|nr:TolC family protein [Nitrospinota bacterium]
MHVRNPVSRLCWLLLGTLLALTLMLNAGTTANGEPRLSLRESITLAFEHNLTIRLAEHDIHLAESGRDQAFGEFLPTLSTLLEYIHKSEAPNIDFSPELFSALGLPSPTSLTRINLGGKEVSSLKVSLRQPLFAGLSITNNYRRSTVSLDIAHSRLRTVQHMLAFEVVRTFLAVLRAQKGEELSAQQVRALEAQAAQSQAFFEEGVIPKNDLLKAEVELANARQNFIRAHNQVELAKAHFNHTLGRDLATPVHLQDVLEIEPLALPELSAALQVSWQQRPELQELMHAVEAAQLGVAVATSQFLPNLNLVGTYTVDLVGSNPNASAERWEVGGVLQWTPFRGGKIRAQVVEAKIARLRASDILKQRREQSALEVKEALLNLLEAQQKIRVAQKAILQAEENFRIAQERYRAHISTSTEVVDTEALLTQARTNYFNAIYDEQLATFALKKATGTILE